MREIQRNVSEVREKLGGEDKYQETISLLEELRKEEEKKGQFVAIEGDIDRRGADKKDI